MSGSEARKHIVELAKQSGVRYQPTCEDALADVVTSLSDDEVVVDDIEDLVVELKRSGVITGPEMCDLLGQYLNEKYLNPIILKNIKVEGNEIDPRCIDEC